MKPILLMRKKLVLMFTLSSSLLCRLLILTKSLPHRHVCQALQLCSFCCLQLYSSLALHLPIHSVHPVGSVRLDIPDALRILIDTPITGEESHPRHARDRLADPLLLIPIRLVHERLRLNVRVEVIADQVKVAVVFDGADEGGEGTYVAKRALPDLVEDRLEVGVERVLAVSVVVAEVLDVLGEVTEEEDVLLADLAGDFDLRIS
jgi:hypothetical protein